MGGFHCPKGVANSVRIREIRGIRVQNHTREPQRFYRREILQKLRALRASAVSYPPLCLETSEVSKTSEVCWVAQIPEAIRYNRLL